MLYFQNLIINIESALKPHLVNKLYVLAEIESYIENETNNTYTMKCILIEISMISIKGSAASGIWESNSASLIKDIISINKLTVMNMKKETLTI